MNRHQLRPSGRFLFAGEAWPWVAMLLIVSSYLVCLFVPPWVSWHQEVLAFAGVLGIAGWAVWKRRGAGPGSPIELTLGVVAPMGLLVLGVLQILGGQMFFAGDVLNFSFYLMLAAAVWLMGIGLGRGREGGGNVIVGVDVIASLILGVAVVSSVLAMAQVFDVWEHQGWVNRMPQLRRPGANLGQPNHLATLLLMGAVSMLYLYELRRLSGETVGLMFGVIVLGLAASESRTGLLNFFLLSLWWLVGRSRFHFKLPVATVATAGLIFLCLFWLWPAMMAANDYFPAGSGVSTGDSMRLLVWSQLLEGIWQRPWLGWGLGEVPEAHNAVVDAHAVSLPLTYAHNIVLDMAIGMGIPLTLLLLAVSGVWLWRRIRAVRDLHTWYCVAAALPVAVHSTLEFPFAYAYFLAPAMFFLGVLDGATGGKVVARISIKWLGAVWLVFAALGAWSVVEYLKIEEDFRIVRFESMRLGQTPQDYERPNIVLLTQLGALLEGGRIVPTPDMLAERIELARKVALRFPWPATQHRYALSLALNGQIDEAERQLRVIRALHGNKTYTEIQANWQTLAASKYPQLAQIRWP